MNLNQYKSLLKVSLMFAALALVGSLLGPTTSYSQEDSPDEDSGSSETYTAPLVHDDENLPEGQISHSIEIDMAAFLAADAAAAVDPSERHIKGEYSDLLDWEVGSSNIHATHAAMMPDGSIVSWHNVYNGIMKTEFTDPTSEAHTDEDISYSLSPISPLMQVNQTTNQMDVTGFFCPGFNLLPDGRMFAVGGNFTGFHRDTLVFDHTESDMNDAWTREDDTEFVRYYGNITVLGSGEMLMFGGQYDDSGAGGADAQTTNVPEIFNETTGWRTLSDASHFFDHNWYQWTQQAPNGKVFYAGPQYDTYHLDVAGNGTWTKLQARDTNLRTYGSYAVYDAAAGDLLVAGGKSDSSFNALANADILDMNSGDVTATDPLNNLRRMGDMTIMADGTVLMSGGISRSNKLTDFGFGVLPSEIWDPETKTWTVVDSIAHPRQYHSTQLLMQDGRVFKAGGGPCAGLSYCDDPDSSDPSNDEIYDAEIYYPPYLYNEDGSWADRPTIVSAPAAIDHGTSFVIQTPDAGNITKAHLIKLGMSTHSQDMGQRLVPLSFSTSGDNLTVTTSSTSNPNVAVPGPYWLFIVDNNGVPSIGHAINVGGVKELTINNPGDQESLVFKNINLPIAVSNPNDATLTFSEQNLPAGLSLNSETGVITGLPTTEGSQSVTISVSGGGENKSVTFNWNVTKPVIANNQAPSVTSPGTLTNTANEAVSYQVMASDPDIATKGDFLIYSANGLPDGLAINIETGLITGTPTAVGNFSVFLRVEDSQGEAATASFNWVIEGPDITIQPVVATPSPVNSVVSYTIQASGGDGLEYKYSISDGTSVDTYNSSNVINHAYTDAGRFSVTVTVRNSFGVEKSSSFIQIIYGAETADPSTSSMTIVYEENGASDRVWNVNPDNDTVSVIDAVGLTKTAEIAVGNQPSAIALAANNKVWVTNKKSATISIINANTLAVEGTLNLPYASKPHGLVMTGDGSTAYVTLEGRGELLKIDTATGSTTATLDIGDNPRHLTIHGGTGMLYISRFITPPLVGEATANVDTSSGGGEVIVVNPTSMTITKTILLEYSTEVDTERSGSGIPNFLGPLVISPDGAIGYVPSKQDNLTRGTLRNNNPLDHDNSIRSVSSYVDLGTELETYDRRIDHDDAAVPTTAAYGKYGAFIFIVMEGSQELRIVDAYNSSELGDIRVGVAPQGIAVGDDGTTVFVHNFLDRTVSVLDTSPILTNVSSPVTTLATVNVVANETLSATELRGKVLFYDGTDLRQSPAPYLTCASCHNDGGQDGRVYDFTNLGEGLRNTIALNGRSGMGHGRLHWSANFDEIQDFENQIRDMQEGQGFLSDAEFSATMHPLGASKAGYSPDLDALAVYVATFDEFEPSPYRNGDGSLTTAAEAGKIVFEQASCASCHTGAEFTDSPSGATHDVGTIKASSGQRLGEGALAAIDTPTLRDVWATAPYLHDGSAATLKDAVEAHTNASLTTTEMNNLVEYLLQIDVNEPAPPANAAPVITPISNQSNQQSESISVQVVASDANNNSLAYSATDLPPGLTIAADTGIISGIATVAGTYNVTIAVNDGYGDVTSTFTWTIQPNADPTNRAPTVSVIVSQVDGEGDSVSFTVTASDPDNDPLTFIASGLPDGVAIDGSTGAITGTPTTAGTYTVQIIATDGRTGSASTSFTWYVFEEKYEVYLPYNR